MKRIIFISVFLLIIIASYAQSGIKTNGTAYTIGKRKMEINLFQNGRYGTGHKSEIELHPLAFFALPHIHYKKRWIDFKLFKRKLKFVVASRHGIYYPQMLLNFTYLQDFIPESFSADSKAPFALGFNNEILISTLLRPPSHCKAPNHLITLKIGTRYAYSADTLLQPNIKQAVLHRETQSVHPKFIWNVQVSGTGEINNFLYYYADLAFHSYGLKPKYFSAESKLGIYGYFGRRMSIFGGIKTVYTYHSDIKGFFAYPLINLYYKFKLKKKKKRQKGLFENDFHFDESPHQKKGDNDSL